MKEYILPKTGHAARMTILSDTDMNDVLALQEATRNALPADKKMFVLPQPVSYFQNLLTRATGLMVGIRTDGILIAQMALMGPMELREAIALKLITNNDILFPHAALTDNVVIFKSMAVHPDWRGNELAHHMIGFAADLPFTRVADHAFAQISVGNKRSWDSFARNGFAIVAAGYDPKDGQPRFVFQKPNFGFDLAAEASADDVDPIGDFLAIVALTQRDALVGVYEAGNDGKLVFTRNEGEIGVMPTVARLRALAI